MTVIGKHRPLRLCYMQCSNYCSGGEAGGGRDAQPLTPNLLH